MFKVEYLCNGLVKKDRANANLSNAIGLTLDTPLILPLVLVQKQSAILQAFEQLLRCSYI